VEEAIMRAALVAGILLLAGAASAQDAQTYPNQTVRIIVNLSAGSAADGLARAAAEKLAKAWGQQVIVDNRPGLAGTAAVAKAAPDGYTLLVASNGHTIAPVVNKNLPFEMRELVGVTKLASVPLVLVSPPDIAAANVQEFVALVKSKPGAMNFSSAGIASAAYLAAEFFRQTTQINIQHIPYRGAPEAVGSIMRGDSHLYFFGVNLAAELIEARKIRALAIATPKRNPAMPNLPTVAESGFPEYSFDAWFGMLAPAGVPKPILDKISRDVAAAMQSPDVYDRLTRQGLEVENNTPDVFEAMIQRDIARYGKMLRDAGLAAN
jgi:tripartite-type tricarboxylate transporter receptor subunit TctC